jgi:hypothetical protein
MVACGTSAARIGSGMEVARISSNACATDEQLLATGRHTPRIESGPLRL